MTRTRTLVLLSGSILLVSAAARAESSAYRSCYLTNALPVSGTTVPGNLPAITFFASQAYAAGDGSSEPLVKLVRDLDQPVPCSIENDVATNAVIVRPSAVLEPGSYSVLYDCSGPYITNPGTKTVTTFQVTAAQALPTRLGTLTHTVDYVAPRSDLTTCTEHPADQRVSLTFQPSPEQVAFAPVQELKVLVNNALVRTWSGAGVPLVFDSVCSGATGFRTGLNAVELRGRLVGTTSELPPLSLQVAVACEQTTGPHPIPGCSMPSKDGGTAFDAGTPVPQGGGCSLAQPGATGWLAALALLLAYVLRPHRRRLAALLSVLVLLPVALAGCAENPDQPWQPPPPPPPQPDAGTTVPSSDGMCESAEYGTAKAVVYKVTSAATCFAGSVEFLASNVPQATMQLRYGNASCAGLSLRACDDSPETDAILAAREQAVASAVVAELPALTCSLEGIRLDGWSSNDIHAQTSALLAAADAADLACSRGLRFTFDASGRLVSLAGSDGSIPENALDQLLDIAGPTQLPCLAGMVLCS